MYLFGVRPRNACKHALIRYGGAAACLFAGVRDGVQSASKVPEEIGHMAKFALYGELKAKPGKEKEVEAFLTRGAEMARSEPKTRHWYAFKEDKPGVYGIFDTFDDEAGRDEHLNGAIAKALMSKADALLSQNSQDRPARGKGVAAAPRPAVDLRRALARRALAAKSLAGHDWDASLAGRARCSPRDGLRAGDLRRERDCIRSRGWADIAP